uniref:Myb/SANT-like domain-containing protein n=1 Tax=Oryza meridionalis TaxID=40149 RepID=A0A0E0DLE7_9ORYZ
MNLDTHTLEEDIRKPVCGVVFEKESIREGRHIGTGGGTEKTFFSSSRELRERAIGRVCHGLILITCTHGIHLHKFRVFLSSMAAKPEAQMGSEESVMAVCRTIWLPQQFIEDGEREGKKAHWDAYASKVFCEICRDEVLAGNRPTAALSPLGYKNLEEKFFAQTGRQYDRTKLKNRWDILKTQHKM